MELHKTQRGKDKLVIDGYAYVKNKYLANDRISYKCANRRGSGKGHKANTNIARYLMHLNVLSGVHIVSITYVNSRNLY